MFLIDYLIEEKFLANISILINQYNILGYRSPLNQIVQFIYTSEYYKEEIFEIYTEYNKRQFSVLEILAGKQGLDTERQAFNIVKNYISKKNIKLTISDIINLYISHRNRRIVLTQEIATPSGLYFINPK